MQRSELPPPDEIETYTWPEDELASLWEANTLDASGRIHAMLVLSRKVGETIVIDGRIQVHVARISGGRVRLLVDAPQDVPVDRLEVWQDKAERSRRLAGTSLD